MEVSIVALLMGDLCNAAQRVPQHEACCRVLRVPGQQAHRRHAALEPGASLVEISTLMGNGAQTFQCGAHTLAVLQPDKEVQAAPLKLVGGCQIGLHGGNAT